MIEIRVTLTFETPLNIGSGAQHGTFADRAMIKTRDGWPYIPASAFKGRLRHAVERIAHAQGLSECVTHRHTCRPGRGEPCPVCRVFGAPWVAGQLRFSRLELTGPADVVAGLEDLKRQHRVPRTQVRYGVAISRRRRVSEESLLYTTEMFEPGVPLSFEGTLLGEITQRETALVVAGLKLLPALGRGKSGGLGWFSTAVQVQEDGQVLDEATLQQALMEREKGR
jgi:CRISPR/Cas system CSM-associated protein Csm3 (group 7 of RAMP superfamily)